MSLQDNLRAVKSKTAEAAKALIALEGSLSDLLCEHSTPESETVGIPDEAFTGFLELLSRSATNEGFSSAEAMSHIGIDRKVTHSFTRQLRAKLRESGFDPTLVFTGRLREVDGVAMTWFYAGQSLGAALRKAKGTTPQG